MSKKVIQKNIGNDEMLYSLKGTLIQEICDLAKRHNMDRVILFGSRARGDNQQSSDIDLAVSGGNFALFCADIEENTNTLLKYDIINLDGKVQEELRDSISTEGIVLYEKI